jgi:type IV pilus assembly protein PilB
VSARHVFQDEWLTRAAATIPGVSARIEALRAEKHPCLFDALVASGAADAETVREAVRATHRIKGMREGSPDKLAIVLVAEKLARRYRLVPVRLHDETIELAMENPLDLEAQADVRAVTGRTPVALHARPEQIEALLLEAYNPDMVVYDLVERLDESTTVEVIDQKEAPTAEAKGPIEKLIGSLISKAFNMRASDIHLEHDEHSSAVRFRIDGVLKNILTLPRNVGAGSAVSRIKIMANLDIADRLRPQDGRAKLRIGKSEIGLRVSTLPTNFGEKVVIRLLDKRSAEVPFEKLGFRPDIAERLGNCLHAAQGVILVTGPTGSGKTTTLYSVISRLKHEHTNIVTVEDPVEYKLDGINQTQVQEKQGLTFAAVLRSVLRQDPDVILVGEIRDHETAETAMQAALTGHLVISSLHTNDTLSTIARLVDMGVQPFKLAPAIIGITAQRLVRTLCTHCRKQSDVVEERLAAAQRARGIEVKEFRAVGCADCDFTGYKGRTSIVEFLEATPGLKKKIAAGAGEAEMREFAIAEKSLSTLLDDALWHVGRGDTSLEEILPYVKLNESVKSEAPAFGTAPAKADAPAAVPAPAAPGGPSRILIADDDATIRIILRKILEGQGYQVDEAEDGPKALASVAGHAPDMILVDLNMPGLDGYGVIRGVRESLGLSHLPILMLTADSDDASQAQAFALGADDYIVKPVKIPLVIARVKAAFRRLAA